MPNADEAALAKYRLNKAEDCLSAAKLLLQDNLYADSANRSYYAIFHAINALFALRSIGFKKHAGVLANFNTDYIKTGIFEIEYAKIAKSAFPCGHTAIIRIFILCPNKIRKNSMRMP